MNLVTLERFNELRMPYDPVPVEKLQRWCRDGTLPARKVGRQWRIDLDAFDRGQTEELDPVAARAASRLGMAL